MTTMSPGLSSGTRSFEFDWVIKLSALETSLPDRNLGFLCGDGRNGNEQYQVTSGGCDDVADGEFGFGARDAESLYS
jgi:hypothetical protein